MKAVILAGGFGTRFSEETVNKPKPMIEIGGRPILWHIMKIFSAHGINEFIICCGYKGYVIKEYFNNYALHNSDVTFDFSTNETTVHYQRSEPWKITLVDTGEDSMTGGRLRRVSEHLEDDSDFCFTYGDGVGNIDITGLISFHKSHNKIATVTATVPPGRFGALKIHNNTVKQFDEKPLGDGSRINGGFFVLKKEALQYIDDDKTTWEAEPLATLASQNQLMAFEHNGFWQPMDTLRDKVSLDKLWSSGDAPWKVWEGF